MSKSYQEALEEKVLAVIQANGAAGILSTAIREHLPARGRGISARDFQRALRHLRAADLIRTEGDTKSARNFATEVASADPLPRPGWATALERQEAVDRAVLGVIRRRGEAGARSIDVLPALRGRVRRSEVLNALRRLRKAKKIRTEGKLKGAINFVTKTTQEKNE